MDTLPAIPFTLLLPGPFVYELTSELNWGIFVNEATNEHFSVSHDEECIEFERTRARAPKKKGKVYEQFEKVFDSIIGKKIDDRLNKCSIL